MEIEYYAVKKEAKELPIPITLVRIITSRCAQSFSSARLPLTNARKCAYLLADLSEDKVKAYRLADNKTGELAEAGNCLSEKWKS